MDIAGVLLGKHPATLLGKLFHKPCGPSSAGILRDSGFVPDPNMYVFAAQSGLENIAGCAEEVLVGGTVTAVLSQVGLAAQSSQASAKRSSTGHFPAEKRRHTS